MHVKKIQTALRKLGDRQKADHSKRFFKTGPGEYGEGDEFLGIPVPALRKLVPKHPELTIADATRLLRSSIHEERLLALFLLVRRYQKGDAQDQAQIYHHYLNHTRYINNWDLIDASAQHIMGAFLYSRDKTPLFQLARSADLWERRIAVMATFHFIRNQEFSATLKIARLLLTDREDLIHKAVGWMLREVGKRNITVEEKFLKKHYQKMPRTMLRYAIEKFPADLRQKYLKGEIGN